MVQDLNQQAEGKSMEEEKVALGEPGDAGDAGDAVSDEAETHEQSPNSNPVKRGRGRPQGSKKRKVRVKDLNVKTEESDHPGNQPTQPRRGRGRPRLSDKEQRPGDDQAQPVQQTHRGRGRPKGSKNQSNQDGAVAKHTPGKRGRPKKVNNTANSLQNGDLSSRKRGRPKGSIKRKLDTGTDEGMDSSSATPRKRGRPKGSFKKTPTFGDSGTNQSLKRKRGRPRLEPVVNGKPKTPGRGRGRPRKQVEETGERGLATVKRGRGRPKGSLNKKPTFSKVGRPRKAVLSRRGRKPAWLSQKSGKRGRPRKYPLPSPEELNKPKVWKPLGRPRKYPRVDPPEGDVPAPRRSRGRPKKSESKKGAHLRKGLPSDPTEPLTPPGKKAHPLKIARKEGDPPSRRGRPKGSVNKNKANSLPNHTATDNDSPDVEEASEAEQDGEKVKAKTKTIPQSDNPAETHIYLDEGFTQA